MRRWGVAVLSGAVVLPPALLAGPHSGATDRGAAEPSDPVLLVVERDPAVPTPIGPAVRPPSRPPSPPSPPSPTPTRKAPAAEVPPVVPPATATRPPKRRDRVRLAVAISPAGRSALDGQGVARYRVTVRPIGGAARDTALLVLAQRPLTWAENPPECVSRGKGAPLRCDLGDLVHVRHVEVAVRIPERARVASVPRVVAIAGASNVRRESVAAATPPAPARGPRPEPTPTRSAKPAPSPARPSAAKPSPARPSVAKPPVAKPPAVDPPTVKPRAAGPRATTPRRNPPEQAPPVRPPSAAPVLPPAPGPVGTPPPLTEVPPLPAPPASDAPDPALGDVPSPSVLPPAGGAPGTPPALSLPGAAPRTPDAQMTLVSPTGLDRGGDGTDWAVVLGIALIAEIALLWVAACLSLWRRRVSGARPARAAAVASRRPPRRRR